MVTDGQFRVAIVGTGAIAELHAADLNKLDDQAVIVAAVDVDPQRLATFADKWSIPGRYQDLQTALRDEQLDLVHLCTPPGLHREQALACMRRGVHVYCEKPPALSLAEVDDIAREQTDHARFTTVLQQRFGSGTRRLADLTRQGQLGRPFTAICHTLWYRPDAYYDVPWRGKWDVEGGGATLGLGVHQMDLVLSVLGPWKEVTAVAARQARPTATEDLSCAIITHESGAVTSVVNSVLAPRQTSYIRFDYELATVELSHLYGYSDENWTVTPLEGYADQVARAWAREPVGIPSGHAAQLSEIFAALRSGAVPPVGVEEVRMTMELVVAIYASSFTGRPVRRGEIDESSPFYRRMDGSGAPWA
jgi:predicted dehydrogenase